MKRLALEYWPYALSLTQLQGVAPSPGNSSPSSPSLSSPCWPFPCWRTRMSGIVTITNIRINMFSHTSGNFRAHGHVRGDREGKAVVGTGQMEPRPEPLLWDINMRWKQYDKQNFIILFDYLRTQPDGEASIRAIMARHSISDEELASWKPANDMKALEARNLRWAA